MSAFEKLAPFIQDHIYRNRWQELHGIQKDACDIIFDTDTNLLISTPTASGKTEAAFLPVLTELHNRPSSSVGVLYISPTKALIDDQFVRLDELLEEGDIPVTRWHGDISQTQKNKLLKDPRGVMQTTPESLEAMLMGRNRSVVGLFSDLRFVIIDEVHHFIASDRGVQLSSVLERIQAATGNIPRRIGLSATLGDVPAAEEWLNNGTGRKCHVIASGDKRRARVGVSHFFLNKKNADDESWTPYFGSLHDLTKGRKSIIFSNSRSEAEMNINRLKIIAEAGNEQDVFRVHHGNISAEERRHTHEEMRTSDVPLVTGATVTLELGIDIGDLERIVQTGSPHSVSSLAQRLGRSGRRSGVSEMFFILKEGFISREASFHGTVDWQLVKCIALIELYRKNWTEPLRMPRHPFNILFHQILSILYGSGTVSPAVLAQKLLSGGAFKNISKDELRTLLRHMVDTGMIEKMHDGTLALGEKGERLTSDHDFYAVFENSEEYSVMENEKEIGTLYQIVPVGERFLLGGKTWEVAEVDRDKGRMYVRFVGGKSTVSWNTNAPAEVHTKVLQKMREVIVSDEEYGYLDKSASARLSDIRETVRRTGAFSPGQRTDMIRLSQDCFGIYPWLGTKAMNALICSLRSRGIEVVDMDHNGISLCVIAEDGSELVSVLNDIRTSRIDAERIEPSADTPPIGKYGEHIPQTLAAKQFRDISMDIDEMQRELRV